MALRPVSLERCRPTDYRWGFGVRGFLVSFLIALKLRLDVFLLGQLFLLESRRLDRIRHLVTRPGHVRRLELVEEAPSPPAPALVSSREEPLRPLPLEDGLLGRTLADHETRSNRSFRYFRGRNDARVSTYGEEG